MDLSSTSQHDENKIKIFENSVLALSICKICIIVKFNVDTKIFSKHMIEFNYGFQCLEKKGRPVEFDVSMTIEVFDLLDKVFIPDLSLAFEYNGEYHYQSLPMYLQCEHSLTHLDTMNWNQYSAEIMQN